MIVAVVGPSVTTLTVVLGVTYWVRYGRLSRVFALSLRDREFVLASRTFGGSHLWIIRKHLLPGLIPSLAILASFDLGVIVILEASLSYLGLGIQPPTPSWGKMIYEGQQYASRDFWLVVWPAIAIFMVVASVQLLSQRFTGEHPQATVQAN
jgi:peptide/nickel transport system permease protein